MLIGQTTRKLLDKMQKTKWVLDARETEYTLTVPITQEEAFILNYMVKVGMNQLTASGTKSFWYSWPMQFTGSIVIHHIVGSPANEQNKFVENLWRAMNDFVLKLEYNWKRDGYFLRDHMYTNDQISEMTNNMLVQLAEKYGHNNIRVSMAIISSDKNALDAFVQEITAELIVPEANKKENEHQFFSGNKLTTIETGHAQLNHGI